MLILSTKVDKKSLETEFSVAICRPAGDKWQWKTLFLAIFDPHQLIVKSILICRLPRVAVQQDKATKVSGQLKGLISTTR